MQISKSVEDLAEKEYSVNELFEIESALNVLISTMPTQLVNELCFQNLSTLVQTIRRQKQKEKS